MGCLRNLVALPAGLVAMGCAVWVLELASHAIYPTSPEMRAAVERYVRDTTSTEAIEAIRVAIPTMPTGAYIALVVAWTAGAFVGAFVAAHMATSAKLLFGILLGVLSLTAIAVNLSAFPHPEWMSLPNLSLLPIVASVGGALVARAASARSTAPRNA